MLHKTIRQAAGVDLTPFWGHPSTKLFRLYFTVRSIFEGTGNAQATFFDGTRSG